MNNKKCMLCGQPFKYAFEPMVQEDREMFTSVGSFRLKFSIEFEKNPTETALCTECFRELIYRYCRDWCCTTRDISKTNIAVSPDLYEAFIAAFPQGENDSEKIRFAIENVDAKQFGNLRRGRVGYWLRRDDVIKMLDSEIVRHIQYEMEMKRK